MGGKDLFQQLVTFPAKFPTEYPGKQAGKAANVMTGRCNVSLMQASCQVPRLGSCDWGEGILGCLELQGPVVTIF